jgi:hypothetical protein
MLRKCEHRLAFTPQPRDVAAGGHISYSKFKDDQGTSEDAFSNTRLGIYVHLYRWGRIPIGLETLPISITIRRSVGSTDVSFGSPLLALVAFMVGYASDTDAWPFLVLLGPQMIGNMKVHIPVVRNHVSLFIGQTTDLFIDGLYTETSVGARIGLGSASVLTSVYRPWIADTRHPDFGLKLAIQFGSDRAIRAGRRAGQAARN